MIWTNLKRWRDQGYQNIYGTDLIGDWCCRLLSKKTGPIRVLDVGCGSGRDLLAIRGALGPGRPVELHGVEAEGLSETARRHGIETIGLDLESGTLPYPDGYFDVVLANQVLEHLKNWLWAFNEQVRVTRPGGLTVIGVPNMAALHNRLLVLFGRQPSSLKADGPHVRGFTLHELERLTAHVEGLSLLGVKGTYLYGLPPAVGARLGQLWPSLSATILLMFCKTQERVDVLSLLGQEARFETSYFVGAPAATPQRATP
jgi:SAM-dependent methyltransferase